jgi:hypothetical protein
MRHGVMAETVTRMRYREQAPGWHFQGLQIPPESAVWSRRLGRLLGASGLALFLYLIVAEGVPQSTYGDNWERPVQFALLGVATLGLLIALKWEWLGGPLMIVAGVGLGALASIEYRPVTSFFAAVVFLTPGVLFLLAWQRSQSLVAVAAVILATALVLAVGGYASDRIYAYYFGPTHPQSDLPERPVDLVEWAWSGGINTTGATVKARLADDHERVRLAVSLEEDVFVTGTVGDHDIATFAVTGLTADTRYFYAVEADGQLERARPGSFRTFPEGPASFSFAFGSCARTGSNGVVFETIAAHDPLFYLATGDIHYENIQSDQTGPFLDAYQELLTRPAQSALYLSTGLAYVWDDHDFGGDNSDSTSISREPVQAVYDAVVPHYPLKAEDGSIYQSFSVGRVRFLMTDNRSARTPASLPDGPAKSMLGEEQKAWLKRELLAARDEYQLIVWVSSGPWIDSAEDGKDTWGGYATEREELADFITDNGIDNILMLSGDAHMLAIDDGTNSEGGFPVFHAAALDRHGRVKGGPYSEGTYPDSGQFGLVTIEDGGDEMTVQLSGRNYKDEVVVEYAFSVPEGEP